MTCLAQYRILSFYLNFRNFKLNASGTQFHINDTKTSICAWCSFQIEAGQIRQAKKQVFARTTYLHHLKSQSDGGMLWKAPPAGEKKKTRYLKCDITIWSKQITRIINNLYRWL